MNGGGIQKILKNFICAKLMDLAPLLEDEENGFCLLYCFPITYECVSLAEQESRLSLCGQDVLHTVVLSVQSLDTEESIGEWE